MNSMLRQFQLRIPDIKAYMRTYERHKPISQDEWANQESLLFEPGHLIFCLEPVSQPAGLTSFSKKTEDSSETYRVKDFAIVVSKDDGKCMVVSMTASAYEFRTLDSLLLEKARKSILDGRDFHYVSARPVTRLDRAAEKSLYALASQYAQGGARRSLTVEGSPLAEPALALLAQMGAKLAAINPQLPKTVYDIGALCHMIVTPETRQEDRIKSLLKATFVPLTAEELSTGLQAVKMGLLPGQTIQAQVDAGEIVPFTPTSVPQVVEPVMTPEEILKSLAPQPEAQAVAEVPAPAPAPAPAAVAEVQSPLPAPAPAPAPVAEVQAPLPTPAPAPAPAPVAEVQAPLPTPAPAPAPAAAIEVQVPALAAAQPQATAPTAASELPTFESLIPEAAQSLQSVIAAQSELSGQPLTVAAVSSQANLSALTSQTNLGAVPKLVAPAWYELTQELVAEAKPGNGLVSALAEVFEPEPKPDYAAQFLSDFEAGHAGSAAINAAEAQSRIEQETREKEDRAREERLRTHFGDEHFDRYIAEDIPKVERNEVSVPTPPDTFESDIFSNAARGTLETTPEPLAQPLPKEELPPLPETWTTQQPGRIEPKFEDMLTAGGEPSAKTVEANVEEAKIEAPAIQEPKTLEEQFPWSEALPTPAQDAANENSSSWGLQTAPESPFDNVIQPVITDQAQAASLYEKLTDELAARQSQSDFFNEESSQEQALHSGTSAPASKWLEPLPKVETAPAVEQETAAPAVAEPVIESPVQEEAQPVASEAEPDVVAQATAPAESEAEAPKPEAPAPRVRPRDYTNPLKQSKTLGDLTKRETETTRMVPRNVPAIPLATPVSQDRELTSSREDVPAVAAPQAMTEPQATQAPAEVIAAETVASETNSAKVGADAPAQAQASAAATALPWVSQTNLPAPAAPVQEPTTTPAVAEPAPTAAPPLVSQTNLPATAAPAQEPTTTPAVAEPAPAPVTTASPPWVSQTNLPAATTAVVQESTPGPEIQETVPTPTATQTPPPWVSQSRLPASPETPVTPSPVSPSPATAAPPPWVSQTKLPAASTPEAAETAKVETPEPVKSTLPWVSQRNIPAQVQPTQVEAGTPAPVTAPSAGTSQTNLPAIQAEAEKKGSQDARLMMNEMATLMSKLEQQVSKAANKLSSRAEELKTRLNKQVEDLLKQASEIERQSEVNLTNLSSELNTRLDNLAIEVRSNIARESASGEDEIDKTGAHGVDKLEQEQRQLSAQIVRTCTDFRSELETMSYGVSKRLEELIENRNSELTSLRTSILDELKDSHESYTSTVEQRFERFKERMNEETVSVTKSLERNMRSMVEEIDSSLDRACEKLKSTRLDLEKTISHTVATAEMSLSKRTKLILSDSIVPKLNEHKIILRTMIADMSKQIRSETQTGFARESRKLEDSTEKAARELKKVVEECFTDFERSGANLKAGLEETYKRAAYDLNQRIQEVHTYIKETEKRILESEHTLRSLAEASSVESEPDLVEERANAMATLQTLKQDANRKMAASIENGLTRLEEKSEALFSELTEKRSESTAQVRDAAESSLDKVRQAIQEATAAIQSAREKYME